MPYLHGALGQIGDSKAISAVQASTVVAYVGFAPINLVKDYALLDLINNPIKLTSLKDAQQKMGYSKEWAVFTLCEAFSAHFNNTLGNIGPIYVVNVLDPAIHRKNAETTGALTFNSGRAELKSDKVIIDTFLIDDKVEDVDFKLNYDYSKETLIITSLDEDTPITGVQTISYFEIDETKMEVADIIGTVSAEGVYSGLGALELLYQNANVIPNLLLAPGYSHEPTVYTALVSAAQKINGHWDAFVLADIPIVEDASLVDTIAKAKTWKQTNGYNAERSKVFWPKVKDSSNNIYHLSTIAAVTMLRADSKNGSVPMESPSNKIIPITKQHFGNSSTNKGFDQQTGNSLNEVGITTAVFWGGNFVLWGPHTAAYSYGADVDPRAIFDVNMRMLMHITNSFQSEWGLEIDSPMNLQLKDTIINREQEKLDTLVARGALIGNPKIQFLEIENDTVDLMNGDFTWNINATPAPPFKSASAIVSYTDEGFSSYFGGE